MRFAESKCSTTSCHRDFPLWHAASNEHMSHGQLPFNTIQQVPKIHNNYFYIFKHHPIRLLCMRSMPCLYHYMSLFGLLLLSARVFSILPPCGHATILLQQACPGTVLVYSLDMALIRRCLAVWSCSLQLALATRARRCQN